MANPLKIATALSRIKGYKDPTTKRIEDWEWKPIEEVTAKLDYPTQVPDYIQGGYGSFMNEQAKRAAKNELNARDLLKAYGITRASVNRGGLSYDTATKAGLKVPRTQELVRPEGAFSEWLGSPLGQQYLKSAERGEINPQALKDIQRKFSPFGMPNQLASDLSWAAQNLPQKSVGLSEKMLSDPSVYRPFSKEMVGIGPAKSGFMASMLGRGDFPTFDARQINLHTRGGGKEAQKYAKRGKGQGGEEAVERLAERQKAMGLELDPSLDPFYQHLTHHAIWDKIGDSQTTHDDVIKAMKNYKQGGLAQMAKGGKTAAWQRAEGKNPEGGLNAKGRASYKAETGGTLKRPQPEGGARRDSFCARMTGMKKKLTSSKTANDPDSRINKALRKWKC